MPAGVSGAVGPWYSAGTSLDVLSVASIDNDEQLLFPAKIEAGSDSRIIVCIFETHL